ncbi:hypothetical protein Tco_0961060 [Tanacetum coccineum]
MEPNKTLVKDEEANSVDVHLYRSMIRSLMYLTASRPDITFAVCACVRFQVTLKTSHLHVIKRIFRYLKGQPKLGFWYPRDSPFDLEDFSDSDYARASLDKKSTTGGCQFLDRRLISWQYKKQTIVANSTTKAEYVATANCCGQVLWIQNQMLNYGFNFMDTKIYIDNESTICIMKNPVFHFKTKHIEIRHHFIRDCYEKKLIQVIKIHTDHNVADLLAKAFDAVVISESSVRSDILFNNEGGIACLTNDEIFENLALIGYEQLSTKLTFQKDHRANEAVHKEGGNSVERAITTDASLVAAQDSDNIIRTQTMTMPNTRSERVLEKPNEPPIPEGHTSGSVEGSMEHTFELIDTVPPTPHDSPLTGGYTPVSDEGRLKLKELMAICTKLSKHVLELEKDKDAQVVEILKLTQRVKKLERKRKSSISHPRRRIYRQKDTEAVDTAGEGVSTAAPRTPPITTIVFDDEDVTMDMAQTLIKMKE